MNNVSEVPVYPNIVARVYMEVCLFVFHIPDGNSIIYACSYALESDVMRDTTNGAARLRHEVTTVPEAQW